MALGILMILFVTMSLISAAGLSLLYLVKNPGVRKAVFYVMAAWGMLTAVISATSLPENYLIERLIAWIIGFISVAGVIVYIRSAQEKGRLIARLLVTASVVLGIVNLFLL